MPDIPIGAEYAQDVRTLADLVAIYRNAESNLFPEIDRAKLRSQITVLAMRLGFVLESELIDANR